SPCLPTFGRSLSALTANGSVPPRDCSRVGGQAGSGPASAPAPRKAGLSTLGSGNWDHLLDRPRLTGILRKCRRSRSGWAPPAVLPDDFIQAHSFRTKS